MATILLAEDDASMRTFITKALERAGHSVQAVEDGMQALEILSKTCKFNLLLTDIVMPGIDGIELAQKTAHLCPDMKVMFITGFAAVTMDAKRKHLQNSQILSKPFHLKDLVQQINQLLNVTV